MIQSSAFFISKVYKTKIKYKLDFLLAGIIAIIALVPSLIIMFLLSIDRGFNEIFFFQYRCGKDNKIFRLIKFKTMNSSRDSLGNLLPDSDRITPIGRFIRRTSIDELPQLFNVLKGDMSLVGPRPLLVEYLPLYNENQRRRHEVKPGITGWAQVNGRNSISWREKFKMDVWYIDNCSFCLDIKILWLTIQKIFKREDINQVGKETVEKFNGHN
jgi:lipopolysaccharide/colanic/teichoic acid biosynthesis glycosyltransferase